MFDRPAWIFNLMPYIKSHRFEGKALDDMVVQMLQQRVLKLAQVYESPFQRCNLERLINNPTPLVVASLCSISNIAIWVL